MQFRDNRSITEKINVFTTNTIWRLLWTQKCTRLMMIFMSVWKIVCRRDNWFRLSSQITIVIKRTSIFAACYVSPKQQQFTNSSCTSRADVLQASGFLRHCCLSLLVTIRCPNLIWRWWMTASLRLAKGNSNAIHAQIVLTTQPTKFNRSLCPLFQQQPRPGQWRRFQVKPTGPAGQGQKAGGRLV